MVVATSDRRLKTNLMPIQHALKKVSKLNGVYFHWIQDEMYGMAFDQNRHVGIIAQELEQVLPEAVFKSNDFLTVDYQAIVPLLIEAIHELEELVQGDAQLDRQDNKIEDLMLMVASLSEDLSSLNEKVQGFENNI